MVDQHGTICSKATHLYCSQKMTPELAVRVLTMVGQRSICRLALFLSKDKLIQMCKLAAVSSDTGTKKLSKSATAVAHRLHCENRVKVNKFQEFGGQKGCYIYEVGPARKKRNSSSPWLAC